MVRSHTDALSPLIGRSFIRGRLKLWYPPYTIDRGYSRQDHPASFRVLDRDQHVVGRYSRFSIAYAVLCFLVDDARLRHGWPLPPPTEHQCKSGLIQIEHQKALRSDALRQARKVKQRTVWGPGQARKRRQQARAALEQENLFRQPGTPPRRGWGEGSRRELERAEARAWREYYRGLRPRPD